MNTGRKKLVVVGDRVLISPARGEERTRVGLYLPQTAVEKAAVKGGRVVEVGPGTPIPAPGDFNDEPWKLQEPRASYVPMEARVGDFALFLKSAAVEIEFEGKEYLIVPHAGILLLVREDEEEERDEAEEDIEF